MSSSASRDLYLSCRSCGNRFLYTSCEQRERQQAGLARVPDSCPACRALEELVRRRVGHVEWYDRRRGYGFVQGEDGSSAFVHASALRAARSGRLAKGMRVSYRLRHTEQGPRAVDVEILARERSTDDAGEDDVGALGAPML